MLICIFSASLFAWETTIRPKRIAHTDVNDDALCDKCGESFFDDKDIKDEPEKGDNDDGGNLTSIKYRGTAAQWSAISKGSNWDYFAGN